MDHAGDERRPGVTTPLRQKSRSLYEVLGVEKNATDDDIKRAYRKLALRYHPDKNLHDDATTTEKFKEINKANAVLSDPNKRKIYDSWGDMGLKMMDQMGEEHMSRLAEVCNKRWLKWLSLGLFIVTLGCFGCFCCCCCCFQCCCNFCFGKYAPKMENTQPPFADPEAPPPPQSNGENRSSATQGGVRATVIEMGPG